jgi:hypothetical protein
VPQTPEQKAAWTRANPVRGGLTPPQWRLVYVLWRLRLATDVQAWHSERAVAAAWQRAGGSAYAPLATMLRGLEHDGCAERDGWFGTWRLHHLPRYALARARGGEVEEVLLGLAQPHTQLQSAATPPRRHR